MLHSIIRILSKQGFCSRKQAVELVKSGRVSFRGRMILDPGYKVPVDAKLVVGGDPVARKEKQYILLNKPAGYVTTRSDELGRATVYRFLKDIKGWIFPVGRLDKDTEGLLIFTNDTAFGEMMTNPASGIKRTYRAWIDGSLSDNDLRIIRSGAHIGRLERCRPAKIDVLEPGNKGLELVEITLAEGKNREIRRIFDSLGKPVKRLVRIRFGPYELGGLKPGEWRRISVV